jgi:hypothetical protein
MKKLRRTGMHKFSKNLGDLQILGAKWATQSKSHTKDTSISRQRSILSRHVDRTQGSSVFLNSLELRFTTPNLRHLRE